MSKKNLSEQRSSDTKIKMSQKKFKRRCVKIKRFSGFSLAKLRNSNLCFTSQFLLAITVRFNHQLFNDRGTHLWTGFYMIGTSVMKELISYALQNLS